MKVGRAEEEGGDGQPVMMRMVKERMAGNDDGGDEQ